MRLKVLSDLNDGIEIDNAGCCSAGIDFAIIYFNKTVQSRRYGQITDKYIGFTTKITDPNARRISALVKLSNFIDTYLFIVKYMDPNIINYLKSSNTDILMIQEIKTEQKNFPFTDFCCVEFLVQKLLFCVK